MKKRWRKLLAVCLPVLFVVGILSNLDVYAADPSQLLQKAISLPDGLSTEYPYVYNHYYASTPEVTSFIDSKGNYNVTCFSEEKLYIYRYTKSLALQSTLEIATNYTYFGNIISDNAGNYYVCWGNTDLQEEDTTVISISKYDYSGKFISECILSGYEASPYNPGNYWGTKIPFDAGTCSMAINNGILACNFAREMYSGHQSNYVFYVNCQTMNQTYLDVPYCSHSFDQDCLATSDGGFLMVNHGDAYSRGFLVSKINQYEHSKLTFHFREGSNRAYGYNETYAQLGGIAETNNAYILCASSERTLSLDVAPTFGAYCSHSESRDLFVQILKKDFYNHSGADMFLVQGETRKAIGTRPENAATELFLAEGTEDYGVIWLTDYDDQYYVSNPKIVSINQNQFLIMWEMRSYYMDQLVSSYYIIMNDDGSIHKNATSIGEVNLATNADITYENGTVYWTTADENGSNINVLNIIFNGWVECTDGRFRYYENDSKITNKWVLNVTGYFYVDADGLLCKNMGIKKDGKWFYVGANGYRFSDNFTGWAECADGRWRYFRNDVAASDEWILNSKGYFYVDAEGILCTKMGITKDGKWFYVGTNGYRFSDNFTGWAECSDGRWRYFQKDMGTNNSFCKNMGVEKDGKWFYVGTNGYRFENKFTGWAECADGRWRYFQKDVAAADEWILNSKGYFYVDAEGILCKKMGIKKDGKWFYVGTNGYRFENKFTGWAECSDGAWRYFKKDVAATDEWIKNATGYFYVNGEGKLIKNSWIKSGNDWYFVNGNGYRVLSSWKKDSKGWCYLGYDGKMVTNAWAKDSKGWCFVGADGYAVTNTWKRDSKGWCYLDSNGSQLKKGWVKENGKMYYLNAEGYMLANTSIKLYGKTYYFNASGVCTNP